MLKKPHQLATVQTSHKGFGQTTYRCILVQRTHPRARFLGIERALKNENFSLTIRKKKRERAHGVEGYSTDHEQSCSLHNCWLRCDARLHRGISVQQRTKGCGRWLVCSRTECPGNTASHSHRNTRRLLKKTFLDLEHGNKNGMWERRREGHSPVRKRTEIIAAAAKRELILQPVTTCKVNIQSAQLLPFISKTPGWWEGRGFRLISFRTGTILLENSE